MFTTVRRYVVTPRGGLDTLGHRVRDTFLPIVRNLPGFVSYSVIGGQDGDRDVVLTISTFTTEAGCQESARRAAEWVKSNSEGFTLTEPQITTGPVLATTVAGSTAYTA